MINVEDMLQCHAEWKIRFRATIRNRELFNLGEIRRDDACQMGAWLYGGGLPDNAATRELRRKHAEFHLAAADVAEVSNSKNFALAEQMLGPGTEFMKATSAVRRAACAMGTRTGSTHLKKAVGV
jgi:methyl-accepting chemotaxis protein